MKPPPIHMMAVNYDVARMSVIAEMRDSDRRLHFIECASQVLGHPDWFIYVHPTADRHRNYQDIMYTLRRQGNFLCRLDDSFARDQQRQREKDALLYKEVFRGASVISPWQKEIIDSLPIPRKE